jgi:hypothetical protein
MHRAKLWSFLSFVSSIFLPEAEGELEIRSFCLLGPFVAQVLPNPIDHLEELLVLTFEVLGLLRECLRPPPSPTK